MAKYENIRALAKKQLQTVTESSDRWKEFLRTAAIAYNYSFPNQLLIYAQNPTAPILPGCGICLIFPTLFLSMKFPKHYRGR